MAERVVVLASQVDKALKQRERGWLLVAVVAREDAGTATRPAGSYRELYFEREPS